VAVILFPHVCRKSGSILTLNFAPLRPPRI
jgi:hypothetical protein